MKLDLQEGRIAKQPTCTTLPSTLTQYHTLGKVAQPFSFQNQTKTTILAQTTNSYHFYHIMPKHKRKRYYHKQQKTFQLFVLLLHLSWLEMGNTRLLTASHFDLSLKKCLTFGGPQHKTQ